MVSGSGDVLDKFGAWVYTKIELLFFVVVAVIAVGYVIKHETSRLVGFLVIAALVGLVLVTHGAVFTAIGGAIKGALGL